MKFQESTTGTKADLANYIKKVVPEIFGGRFVVEGQTVNLPSEDELEYTVKYSIDESGSSFALKVSWENASIDEQD